MTGYLRADKQNARRHYYPCDKLPADNCSYKNKNTVADRINYGISIGLSDRI